MFRNAIFAGGGSRCFWQLGFWDGANTAGLGLSDTVEAAGSTSAGCAIAMAALLGRGPEALDLFKGYTARNERNLYWKNLLPGKPGRVLPHIDMYRAAIDEFLDDADIASLQQKQMRFLMSAYPERLGGPFSALLGFVIYGLEKRVSDPVHPAWPRRLGYRPLIGDIAECSNKQDLIELVLAASCVPPVLPGGRYRDRGVLDGGLIDNVPVIVADDWPGQTLVLLSRRYQKPLPHRPGFTYVQPSRPITIDKFDYAWPEGLQETYELGYADGCKFVETKATAA